MDSFLPFFPLNLVVYPQENLNLHIFEPRYQQLITECMETDQPFGIPTFLNSKLPGYGTEVTVTTLHKRYDDGQMDISTQGQRVFRIETFENPVAGKLYAGGEVTYFDGEADLQKPLPELLELLATFYDLLTTPVEYNPEVPLFSFQIAHKVGLPLDEEYHLLTIALESERQLLLIQHLRKIIPVVKEIARTKDRIRMNGHFKNLDPLTF
ncbi:LON peptidase substrate-binding domain-containing protein [Rhabdobacter roseus]|uniref:Lon N-terminal domain-containing protein n=1 Tax=Rhabdobacter roseus TaxID=1655419 RepID=A0A840TFJ3_9BACT|nr:LON peptidase substrate-binding domain-containing protein [Rhabdobacter roseus]MBB5281921.1 hypothetical protein [Rhabdobacter roseus]